MSKPSDYRAVRAWGLYLGSFAYYIESQQETAFMQNAPIDALYYSMVENRWICRSDLAADHQFHEYMDALEAQS